MCRHIVSRMISVSSCKRQKRCYPRKSWKYCRCCFWNLCLLLDPDSGPLSWSLIRERKRGVRRNLGNVVPGVCRISAGFYKLPNKPTHPVQPALKIFAKSWPRILRPKKSKNIDPKKAPEYRDPTNVQEYWDQKSPRILRPQRGPQNIETQKRPQNINTKKATLEKNIFWSIYSGLQKNEI